MTPAAMSFRRLFGKFGEEAALQFVKKRGYKILHTNWHCQWGEIDIAAKKGDRIFFFEVKTRKKNVLESVSAGKMKHLLRTIQIYLKRYGHDFSQFQVDFIGVETACRKPSVIHLENVLEARL